VKSLQGKSMAVKPLAANISEYDTIELFAPIWAGHLAPPVTAALEQLAKGTKINLHCVSASGKSEKQTVSARISALGLNLTGYEDIKTAVAK
jgi:hypothetical protein